MVSTSGVKRKAMRGALLLLVLVAMTALTFGQDLILNGNQTNNGTINVKRNIINNTAGAITVSGTGAVQLAGAAGATTHSIQGGTSFSFTNLNLIGGRTTTLAVATAVTNQLNIGIAGAGNNYTAPGVGFDLNGKTLTIGNGSSYFGTSTAALTFNGASSTVVFDGVAAQTVLNNAAGVTYNLLTLSGAGTKSLQAGGLITAATFNQSGGNFSVTENFDVTGTATVAGLADITAAKKIRLTAAATGGTITSMANTTTGTLENAGTSTLTVTTLTGNAGTINQSGGGTGTIAFTNPAVNTHIITTATGNLTFSAGVTNAGGTISATGAGFVNFGGDIATSPGTLSFNGGSTATYNGAVQDIAVTDAAGYGSLVLAGSANKTGTNSFKVTGNLTLTRSLAMSATKVLTMTSTTAANVSGAGEVTGAVRRNHAFAAGQNYRFNRQDVYLGTAAAATDITLTMADGTDPSGGALPTTKYIKRDYALNVVAAGNLTDLQLAWASPAEELGGIGVTKVGARAWSGASWVKINNAGYTRNSVAGLLTISGLSNSMAGWTDLGMFQLNYISIANNAVLQSGAGWDENAVPTATDDAIIAHTGVKVGNVALSVGTFTVNAGSDVTTDNAAGTLTVATTTSNAGTITLTAADANLAAATTSGAGIFSVGVGRTLTASSLTNNSSGTSTFTGDVALGSLTNTAGTLNFNGGASTITGAMSNAATGVINIGGTLTGLTSAVLTFTSPGNISLTGSGTFNVGNGATASSLSMTGTSTLNVAAAANLNVFGDLTIASGATLTNAGTITVGQ